MDKVTKGTVVKVNDSERKIFVSEDAGKIKNYLLTKVFIPKTKDLIFDSIVSAVRILLFGEGAADRARTNVSSNGSVTRINYNNNIYNSGSSSSSSSSVANQKVSSRSSMTVDSIKCSRADCELVLDRMYDSLRDYKKVTVADYYEFAGFTPNASTDRKYGWTDLTGSDVVPCGDEYTIILPRPKEI